MEEDIGRYCLNRRSRRTICRTGSIDVLADVQRVNVATAREVIILGDEARGESSDGQVFKAVLACAQALAEERTNSISGTPGPTMVAAIGSERTRRVLTPIVASQPEATVLLLEPRKTLSRILAQSSACPTLAGVYRDLLSYGSGVGGSSGLSAEIYIVPVRRCRVPVGTTFDECLLSFPKAIPIGFFSDGKMVLNPYSTSSWAEHRLRADDSLIVVADSFQDVKWEPVETEPCEFKARALPKPARSILLMGSGLKAQMTLDSLPHYLPAGSRIVCPDEVLVPEGSACAIEHIPLGAPGDIDDGLREVLPGVDTVVLVDDEDDRERHDGRMLYLLGTVHVRSLEAGHRQPDIVVELLDPRNRDIARAVGARETIVSSEIVSNYMVQLARQSVRAAVFADLLDPESSEVYVKPWDVYGLADEDLNFEEIVLRARSLGQVAIGYARGGTPILCPADRRRKARLASYEEIVVIAEE